MNNKMLQKLVETTSLEYFKQPFKHKAYFNSRLRTTGGRYVLSTHHIEINPKQFSRFGKEALINLRIRKVNTDKMRCGKCGSKLKLKMYL